MAKPSVIDPKIIEALRSFPEEPLSAEQIADLVMRTLGAVQGRLRKLVTSGTVTRVRSGSIYVYRLAAAGAQPSKPAPPPAAASDLQAELAALRQWKADAIARYPDLAVPALRLRARQIASDVLRANGDHRHADDILSGRADNTALVKATEAALESAQ